MTDLENLAVFAIVAVLFAYGVFALVMDGRQ
jgi:hypothetical protein